MYQAMNQQSEDFIRAVAHLDHLLEGARVRKQHAYQPGEIQAVLKISSPTFHRLCNLWEPTSHGQQRGIESYRITTQRRVTHTALLRWIIDNARENNQ